MKILMVAEDWAWPATGGGLMRLAKVIEALSEIGDVDLFSLYDSSREVVILPENISVARLRPVHYPRSPKERTWRTAWLRQKGVPHEVLRGKFDARIKREFEAWVADTYDVAWFSTAATYEWVGRPKLGPTIVDLMDLEDVKAEQRAKLLDVPRKEKDLRVAFHDIFAIHQVKKNAKDWNVFQSSVASEVDRVVLCSEPDVSRSGLANAVCVPNSYERPEQSLGRLKVASPPVALLQGSLNYGPNMDAVEWLIEEIAPKLWSKISGIEIRLVGKPTTGVQKQHNPPSVTVVGRVPEIEPELARADIALVPLRIGSGTRLKILESFAHRIPIISTSVGADGLDVQDEVHLLIADDPESFAEACQRFLEDPALRERVVDAAEKLYLDRYEWAAVKSRLQEMVREVSNGTSVDRPGHDTRRESGVTGIA